MSKLIRVPAPLLLAFAIAASPAVARAGTGGAHPFVVKSTIDGKTELPQRVHWIAKPGIAASKVVEVIFLIDGKIAWVEHKPPYVYGNDGNWLVTSAFKPGLHRFTVRTTTADVKTVSKTVKARVLPAAAPPAQLAGSWQRTVTKEQAGSDTPPGPWGITIDSTGWIIRDPDGFRACACGNWIDAAYISSNLLELRSGIWTQPNNDQVKLGGNGWCNDTNAPVQYTWAVSADTLTLTLNGPDLCGDSTGKQDGVVAGVWTRVA
jgi:hypothetical protein